MGNISKKNLFRKEVIDYSKVKLEGGLIIIQEISYTIILLFLSFFLILLIFFAFTASFNRFETVHGLVSNTSSTLKVFSPKPGLLTKIYVNEKDVVSTGDKLAILRSSVTALHGESSKELEKNEIVKQIDNLHTQLNVLTESFKIQKDSLELLKLNLVKKLESLNNKIIIQQKNLSLNESLWSKQQSLFRHRNISEVDIATAEKNFLSSKLNVEDLKESIADVTSELKKAVQDLDSLPNLLKTRSLPLENEISVLRRQLINIENDIEVVVYASHGGQVSNILNKVGENISVQYPLLTILPVNSKFILELYVPSRAVGFVTEGMAVRARFNAFPSQIYGDLKAKVFEVSDTMLFPNEWPNPTGLQQPVYRVRAELEQQSFNIDGENIDLRAGLSVEADLILERRTFADIFFEPVLKQISAF